MNTNDTDVFNQVSTLIAERFLMSPAQITRATDFERDLELDSIDSVDLLMGVNDLFHIQIPEETLPEIHTVGHLVDAIEKYRSRTT